MAKLCDQFAWRLILCGCFLATVVSVSGAELSESTQSVTWRLSPASGSKVKAGNALSVTIETPKGGELFVVEGSGFAAKQGAFGRGGMQSFRVVGKTPLTWKMNVPNDVAGPVAAMLSITNASDTRAPHFQSYQIFVLPDPKYPPKSLYINDISDDDDERELDYKLNLHRLRVVASYAGSHHVELSDSAYGAAITLSDPTIVSVAPDGLITPKKTGTSLLTAEYLGLRAQVGIRVTELGINYYPPVELTRHFNIERGEPQRQGDSDYYKQTVKIINKSKEYLLDTHFLVLNGVDREIEILRTEKTKKHRPLATPYLEFEEFDRSHVHLWKPGESKTIIVEFRNPQHLKLNYQPYIYAGTHI